MSDTLLLAIIGWLIVLGVVVLVLASWRRIFQLGASGAEEIGDTCYEAGCGERLIRISLGRHFCRHGHCWLERQGGLSTDLIRARELDSEAMGRFYAELERRRPRWREEGFPVG